MLSEQVVFSLYIARVDVECQLSTKLWKSQCRGRCQSVFYSILDGFPTLLSRANLFGGVSFNLWFSEHASPAKFSTDFQELLHKHRKDLSLSILVGGSSPQIASVVCNASSKCLGRLMRSR